MESDHSPPGSSPSRIPPSFVFPGDSPPGNGAGHNKEEEKLELWAQKIADLPSGERDPGAIARAQARLADPNYPDDEILETVALNLILENSL